MCGAELFVASNLAQGIEVHFIVINGPKEVLPFVGDEGDEGTAAVFAPCLCTKYKGKGYYEVKLYALRRMGRWWWEEGDSSCGNYEKIRQKSQPAECNSQSGCTTL